MINLTKVSQPPILVTKGAAWTKALMGKLAKGEKPTNTEKTRYRHKDIKKALVEETQGKCAYCESKFLHVHHGDVEHIYPKSLKPEKSFEWGNLTLSCEICNQHKSSKDPFLELIIDPYTILPKDHLVFAGSLVFPLGSPYGVSTIVLLELNRAPLVEMRQEKLEGVMKLYDTLMRDDIPMTVKKVIYEQLSNEVNSGVTSYTAMLQEVMQNMLTKLPSDITE